MTSSSSSEREQRAANRRKKHGSLLVSSSHHAKKTSSASSEREQKTKKRRDKLELSLVSSGSHVSKVTYPSMSKVTRRQMLYIRLDKFRTAYFAAEEKRIALEEERFGELLDPDSSTITFDKERTFGKVIKRGDVCIMTCSGGTRDLSQIVVLIALYDGDKKMLFACSGIPVLRAATKAMIHRFVTSARLVTAYNENRNKEDKLKVEVHYDDDTTAVGFLGLYDGCIAIVTTPCLPIPHVYSLQPELQARTQPVNPGQDIYIAGRAFRTGCLMIMGGKICTHHRDKCVHLDTTITEAALGGPLIGRGGRFLGMIYYEGCEHNKAYSLIISQKDLYKRLQHFQILNSKNLDFRGYSLPKGVSAVVPSGFRKRINHIKSLGYPIPPPLVLEFNGKLLNVFEGYFGELRAWKGFISGVMPGDSVEFGVWELLKKKAVSDIPRRVVLLESFDGYVRSFVCTGLFIKWDGSTCPVILTSASLVRSEDGIDKSLKIEVFLPPKQRARGTLEFYSLNYNIAIVSVEKSFRGICPEDIFSTVQEPSEDVVAIGRDAEEGLLMASRGKVKRRNMRSNLDCGDLKMSTCKINKVGIGGPLVNFNGNLVGMNFYDGRSEETPFLARSKIVSVLRGMIGLPLPSERGLNSEAIGESWKENRWPVPEPYWYHGALGVDSWAFPPLRGRTLQ